MPDKNILTFAPSQICRLVEGNATPADQALADASDDALAEACRAKSLHENSFHSAHEGFAIIMEEMDELQDHVFMRQSRRDLAEMRKEAIQLAAMALRFASECCTETVGRI